MSKETRIIDSWRKESGKDIIIVETTTRSEGNNHLRVYEFTIKDNGEDFDLIGLKESFDNLKYSANYEWKKPELAGVPQDVIEHLKSNYALKEVL